MGAETQNQQLAGGSAARARLAQDLKARRRGESTGPSASEGRERRIRALEEAAPGERGPGSIADALAARREGFSRPEVGEASMFPGERPGMQDVPKPPGLEEARYAREELTRERTRSGRREELYNQFRQAAAERGEAEAVTPGGAVERGSSLFGTPFGQAGQPRSGIAFGPGRASRMPDAGTPEYNALVERMRSMGRR